MSPELALVIFVGVMAAGVLVAAQWWRESTMPLPARPHPSLIFRLVKRDERAVYVRIMRRTLAVQMRDMGRAMVQTQRLIGKALLPTVRRLADEMAKILGR